MNQQLLNQVLFTCFFAFCFSSGVAQDQVQILSKEALQSKIITKMLETQRVYDWEDSDVHTIWSALINSDSIAGIGINPYNQHQYQKEYKSYEILQRERERVKQDLITDILEKTKAKYGERISRKDLLKYGESDGRPYLFIKIWDYDMVKELMASSAVRYFEPTGFSLENENARAGEGCSDYSQVLNAADYTNISPGATQSWHHLEHNVDTAWTKCNAGKDIWIAVLDSGVSGDNPKFNGEFTEGESANREIEKHAFYPPSNPDGWEDQCGHGSAMAGLACAPRGFAATPAGVAYKANLASYRVTNDVRINTSDEKNAVSNALYSLGDSTKINIVSMSIGDVFSSGVVKDGVVYAHDKGKLIFAAGGTSTTFTNWYGVIFPANLPQTVAVTGAVEGTTFDKCDICHAGNEIDFTIYMERAASGNKAVTITNDDENAFWRGYVGGSSAATATMAGIAALVWGNNPALDNNQILNRLIQTSSEYPNRDPDFGWGVIDACEAVDSNFVLPCASSIGNSVEMEITNIVFPPIGDGFLNNNAEIVIRFDSTASYFFNVPVTGASGNPASYNDPNICDAAPIIIPFGNTVCGDTSFMFTLETHEDDGGGSDCDYSSTWDDDLTITTEEVFFDSTTFSQATSNGDFVFSYTLYCTPTLIAGLVEYDSPTCYGENITLYALPPGQNNYEFFLDSNNNNQFDVGESLQNGTVDSLIVDNLTNGAVVGVVVEDASACTDTTFANVVVSAQNYANANALTGQESTIADYETDGIIHSTQTIDSTAIVDYDSALEICLNNGFEVKVGALFEAFINGCDDGGGGGVGLKEEKDSKKE